MFRFEYNNQNNILNFVFHYLNSFDFLIFFIFISLTTNKKIKTIQH